MTTLISGKDFGDFPGGLNTPAGKSDVEQDEVWLFLAG